MRRLSSVLILWAGLGSSFSFAQIAQQKDPFNRYLAGIKANRPEVALVRFAGECGIKIAKLRPRFAVGPGSSVIPVKNMERGLRNLETDFYSTAEVWVEKGRVVVEFWANSDDVGSEVRYLKCFVNGKLLQAEAIGWTVPVTQSPHILAWGYSRRWQRGTNGHLQRTKAEFVDGMEQPISKPELDEDDKKSLFWIPPLGPLNELKLPPAILR